MCDSVQSEVVSLAEIAIDWLKVRGPEVVFDLLASILLFFVGKYLIGFLGRALSKAMGKASHERELLAKFIISVLLKVAWAVLFVIILSRLGVEVAPLIAGLGVTGFILGFAFQESLASLAAGVMIAFNEPFKIGDYVSIGGYEGTVLKLDMMAVVLATADNRRVTIPNKQCWGSPIVNYSSLELRRVDLAVGVAYGTDIAWARKIACDALASLPTVLKDPSPLVEVKSLDDSAVVLTCRVWVANADYWPTFFAGNQKLLEELARANITIPFPQLDVHLDKNA